ncbi:MAG TPA: pyridoxamine 5'-phosphate oxidase family protein [Chryseosolibacter sp.]|nr:pyridoxamine 5'-phosphate oxidase family protein [Chryseosolibacter sp.]
MVGQLTNEQIQQVLAAQLVGRIGCHAEGKTYVVPVAFAFDETHIYAHSKVGAKILIMRKNRRVCFQVDIIDNMANWRSVIIQGEYEELKSNVEQLRAFKLLKDRLSPFVTSDTTKPVQPSTPGEKRLRPVFFRISMLEKSGLYEKK